LITGHINLSNNQILLFQSFPNLFPNSHTSPIIMAAFFALSLTCTSCPPFLCNLYPKYVNSFISSILFPFHHQSFLHVLSFPFLNLIVLVLSAFSSNRFLSRYSSILPIMLLIFSPSSESNTMSSAYVNVYTFLSPNLIPPHFILPISSSRSAIITLNSNGLNGHSCLNLLAIQKLSPVFPPALTLLFVSLNTSLTLSNNLSYASFPHCFTQNSPID
ncbi:hypothetical protein ALC57_15722, partial [Trachymyrmex cornetzi]